MAPPLVQLSDIALTFGGTPLLDGVELSVSADERVCLVGRNGSGKSTLLKITAGLIEPDRGNRFAQPGATIRYLAQEPELGMDKAVIFAPDLFHVLPQPLLDVERAPVQLTGEIVVLLADGIAEILFDQAGSQVKCRLKLGYRAQQMDLVRGTALFESRAPLLGIGPQVL